MDPVTLGVVAMVAFFIMMPTSHLGSDADGNLVEGVTVSGLSFDYIGPNGIFMALIAEIKNISVEELAEITSRNASSLFDFNR